MTENEIKQRVIEIAESYSGPPAHIVVKRHADECRSIGWIKPCDCQPEFYIGTCSGKYIREAKNA